MTQFFNWNLECLAIDKLPQMLAEEVTREIMKQFWNILLISLSLGHSNKVDNFQ